MLAPSTLQVIVRAAVSWADTASVDMKRYDLMHAINTRGTFLCTKLCAPYLAKVRAFRNNCRCKNRIIFCNVLSHVRARIRTC